MPKHDSNMRRIPSAGKLKNLKSHAHIANKIDLLRNTNSQRLLGQFYLQKVFSGEFSGCFRTHVSAESPEELREGMGSFKGQ